MNEWGGKPLPISASCWVDGELCVRLSGAPLRSGGARYCIGGDTVENDASLWESLREQTARISLRSERSCGGCPFPRRRPPLEPRRDADRMGRRAALGARNGCDAPAMRARRGDCGGHATRVSRVGTRGTMCSRRSSRRSRRIHRNLKAAVRPARHFQPRTHVPGSLNDANQPRGLDPRHAQGKEADAILRKCVHCGFCTATCPTYQLLGDELDGPRGRIYLIKQMLEGRRRSREDAAAPRPLPHLPQLRNHLPFRRAVRPAGRHRPQASSTSACRAARAQTLQARMLLKVLPTPALFASCMKLGRLLRPLLPASAEGQGAATRRTGDGLADAQPRAPQMLVLEGCVQPAHGAEHQRGGRTRARPLRHFTRSRPRGAGCCGAIALSPERAGRGARRHAGATSTPGGRYVERAPRRS